jgi:hypothetical protein
VELVGVAKMDIPDGQAIGSRPFSNPLDWTGLGHLLLCPSGSRGTAWITCDRGQDGSAWLGGLARPAGCDTAHLRVSVAARNTADPPVALDAARLAVCDCSVQTAMPVTGAACSRWRRNNTGDRNTVRLFD